MAARAAGPILAFVAWRAIAAFSGPFGCLWGTGQDAGSQQGPRRRRQRSRRQLLPLLLAGAVGACNAAVPDTIVSPVVSASPTSRPSPAASPTPTPTSAPDVASVAARRLRDLQSASVEIKGRSTSGGEATITGRGELTTDASRFEVGVESREGRYETVEISVQEGRFTSHNGGPFLRAQPVADGDDMSLAAFLRGIGRLVPAGTETRDGRLLHRLLPAAGTVIPPSALGLTGPGLKDFRADLEIYADADGTPVELAFDARWREPPGTGDQPSRLRVSYHLNHLDEPLTVRRPAEVWITHVSKRWHYTVAYPEEWEIDEMDDGDSFLGPDGSEVFIWTAADAGSLNTWVTDSILFYQDEFGQRPESNEPVTIAGQDARLLSYHADIEESPTFVMDALVVHEGRGYDLEWYSVPGNEAADRQTFQEMLSTFGFR
jgi:hypothetical protein